MKRVAREVKGKPDSEKPSNEDFKGDDGQMNAAER